MDTTNIKVAFVTDDGTTISQHFGRARYYEVLTVANNANNSIEYNTSNYCESPSC